LLKNEESKVKIKERALKIQLEELESFITTRISARFKELKNDVTQIVNHFKQNLEDKRTEMERFVVQADYTLAFTDHSVLMN